MNQTNPRHIVFVTGSFVGNNCWDNWKAYFEDKGYQCVAPPWPCKDASPAALRSRHPSGNAGLTRLTLKEVVNHYADVVRNFTEKPIVIGHSMGGLITQILVSRGLAAAAAAIHPVPPMGVIPYEFSFYKAGWKSLGLFSSAKKTYLMSFKDWQYAFVNGMSPEEQQAAYDMYTIPESYRVTRGALTSAAKVNFKHSHAPLLIASGSSDHLIPAHLNHRNFKRYKPRVDGVTEYKEFPGRNHFVLGQPTWREDAGYILDWLEKQFQNSTNGVEKTAAGQPPIPA